MEQASGRRHQGGGIRGKASKGRHQGERIREDASGTRHLQDASLERGSIMEKAGCRSITEEAPRRRHHGGGILGASGKHLGGIKEVFHGGGIPESSGKHLRHRGCICIWGASRKMHRGGGILDASGKLQESIQDASKRRHHEGVIRDGGGIL